MLPDGSPVQSGSMAVPRMGHTATRLTDGRVLICGGITNIAVQGRTTTATLTNTAEVFDPASFQSIPTDAAGGTTMTAYRLSHTGTLIENGPNGSFAGAVLIAGGSDSGPSAELFDPSSNGFAGTAALHGTEMQVRRSGHQATWLPGINLVLITGGAAPQSGGGVLAAAEIYNPGGGFIRIRDMNLPRVNHTATNIGLNVVLIAGGLTAPQRATDSAELWNPQSQAFTVVAHPMTRRRANHSAVLLSTGPRAGDVVIVGGLPTAADADLFHPADQTFMAEFPAGTFGPYNNTATLVMPTQPAQCP